MIHPSAENSSKSKTLELLFIALLVSFPFGSFFGSFSLGFMTMYPYLALLLVLMTHAVWRRRIPGTKLERWYLLFLLFFVCYNLAFLPFSDHRSYALVDVRSAVLMLFTSWVIIHVKEELGFERWRLILVRAFYLILFMLTFFALLEMMSGWHVPGSFTEKISVRQIEDSMSFMPVFLWDNPNTFLTYFVLIVSLILLLDNGIQQSLWKFVSMLFLVLFFSIVEESRLGIAAVVLAILIYLGFYLIRQKMIHPIIRLWPYWSIALIGITWVLVQQDLYQGIPPEREKVVATTRFKYPVASAAREINPDLLVETYGRVNLNTTKPDQTNRNSNSERFNLVKNGIYFLKESHFLGIGPGGFRFRHDTGNIPYHTFGNNGPHFWLVELLSQYGLLVVVPYLLFFGIVLFKALKAFRQSGFFAVTFLIALFLFAAASILPSAFLILDINWIFTVVVFVAAGQLLPSFRVSDKL